MAGGRGRFGAAHHVQLREDATHMRLHRGLADKEISATFLIISPTRHESEDIQLRDLSAPRHSSGGKLRGQWRRDTGLTAMHPSDTIQQLRQRHVLQQVSARTSANRLIIASGDDGEAFPVAERMPLFEAARWAPSSFNAQQWRALYAGRDSEHWPRFFGSLVDANKVWAKTPRSSLSSFPATPWSTTITHSYDTGAAWENFTPQAFRQGLAAHGMQGID